MAVGRGGRQVSGEVEPERLACAVFQRIRERDLPAGMELIPEKLAPVMRANVADVCAALELLERRGATVRSGPHWQVRQDRCFSPREFLLRVHPLLNAVVRMAALNITQEQAAAVAEAYERFSEPASGLDASGRADAYRRMLTLIARGSGSVFHQTAVERALREAAGMIEEIVADVMRLPSEPDPDDELARLTRALMASDAESAVQAIEDHVLVVGVRMNRLF